MPADLNEWVKKKILVTGGTGFLGTSLIRWLRDTDCLIVRMARPGKVFEPVLGKAHIEDVNGDICSKSFWDRVLDNAHVVFHFAAQTSVYVANESPSADLDINVVPMVRLLEACLQKPQRQTILFSSTVTISGLPSSMPVDETYPDSPITIYDLHKLMAETYLKYFVRQGVVGGAVLRLANVYGPGPRSSSPDRGILNMMIRKALNGETLTIYGEGDPVRDYVYIDDVVHAFLEAGAKIGRLNGQHFVVGSGQGHTIAEAVNMVADRVALKMGHRVPVIHIDPPVPQSRIEARNFVANTTRFSQATGWKARVSLVEGIDQTIDAFLAQERSSL